MRQSVLRLLLLLTALPFVPAPAPARGQDAVKESYSRFKQFRIPFEAGPGVERLREMRLYVSTDQGRTWNFAARAEPTSTEFRFATNRDGVYWFTVQTVDKQGQLFPANLTGAELSLKVVVDTQPPVVRLSALPPRSGQVGVSWTINDENPDTRPDALRMEYRVQNGNGSWMQLRVNPQGPQFFWTPETTSPLEVRLKATDRAGNVGEDVAVVSLSGQGAGFPQTGGNPPDTGGVRPSYQAPIEVDRRLVNKKQFHLQYQVDQVGKSGLSGIDVWFTKDNGGWQKYENGPADKVDRKSSLLLNFPDEGLYGITLVAKSGVGLSEAPPRPGDAPQVWVEIDITPPAVKDLRVLVGRGADKGKLAVYWQASDKNLARKPITIFYAENQGGPWNPMTTEPQLNSGPFVWNIPNDVPSQFYVKVQASDRAGNVGEAISADVVKVDLSVPKAKILNVDGN